MEENEEVKEVKFEDLRSEEQVKKLKSILNDINNMKSMFNLVPYNNITDVKRHPDFVVMYPYQPSENLDNGSSFENDGFMLNRSDEMANLPEALTSRSDNTGVQGFYLPAFGVAYGKQYQSMFSNIDVGMESPMVTEQSLKAKMVIAMQGAGEDKSGNSKGVVTAGQDLYSIYASNSYTCTVTMMGCAWVQPLMYFVLLNIPMFRGSYLIEKVSHHLEPGNMTTTFVGVRMANVSTRALKNPLYVTDSNNNGSYSDDLEAMQFKAADLDNDCPYTDEEGNELKFVGKSKVIDYINTHDEFREKYFEMLTRYVSQSTTKINLLDEESMNEILKQEASVNREVFNEDSEERQILNE